MRATFTLFAALSFAGAMSSAGQAPTPSRGQRYDRLLIRNAMIIDGAGNPTRGPMDILVEGSTIRSIRPARPINEFGTAGAAAPETREPRPDRVIDATGMYVMPGIIDVHSHIQFSRNNVAMPRDYQYKLMLGHGITTIRDPGSGEGIDTIVAHAKLSAENKLTAPTILPYATAGIGRAHV